MQFVSTETAKKLIEEGARLLDVRTQPEFLSGHIEGAKNVPLNELAARLKEFADDKNRPIIVYCQVGGRSGQAKIMLEREGFTAVHNLGGIGNWEG